MVPTKDRNVQGIFLKFKGEGVLVDCGEGTQRQMNIVGINRNDVKRVLISHWHGDHVSGLVGLIQTIGNQSADTERKLVIYGPQGTKDHVQHIMKSCLFESKLPIEVNELLPKQEELLRFFENDEFALECVALRHSVPTIGYSFVELDRRRIHLAKAKKLGVKEGPMMGKLQQGKDVNVSNKLVKAEDVTYLVKGKKISFILDTEPCPGCSLLAKHADVLVCESSFTTEHDHKAEQFKHMTAKNAALIAQDAEVDKLILTHFSQRYTTAKEPLEEAKSIFPSTEAAFDFMKIKI